MPTKFLKKAACLVTASIFAIGCASSPDELSASYTSPLQYQSYTCNQLGMEAAHIERRVSELYGILDKKASNDSAQMAAGMIIFWPALFFLEGGDGPEAAEYRRLKGDYEAIQKVSIKKNCSLEFDLQKSIPKKVKQVQKTEAEKRISGQK